MAGYSELLPLGKRECVYGKRIRISVCMCQYDVRACVERQTHLIRVLGDELVHEHVRFKHALANNLFKSFDTGNKIEFAIRNGVLCMISSIDLREKVGMMHQVTTQQKLL